MKKLLLILVTLFAFSGLANAAVNINSATQAQLETLKGVGPAKAKEIIEYRKKNGPFKTVDDLEKVKGIGPGILKKIHDDITVSGTTTVKEEKSSAKEMKKDDKAAAKEMKKEEKASAKEIKKGDRMPAPKDSKKY